MIPEAFCYGLPDLCHAMPRAPRAVSVPWRFYRQWSISLLRLPSYDVCSKKHLGAALSCFLIFASFNVFQDNVGPEVDVEYCQFLIYY